MNMPMPEPMHRFQEDLGGEIFGLFTVAHAGVDKVVDRDDMVFKELFQGTIADLAWLAWLDCRLGAGSRGSCGTGALHSSTHRASIRSLQWAAAWHADERRV